MHAGYGIGALIAVQISKPFIKFDPLDKYRKKNLLTQNSSLNNQSATIQDHVTSDKIELQIPYNISALFAIILCIIFFICQFIEEKNAKLFRNSKSGTKLALLGQEKDSMVSGKSKNVFIKLLFGDKGYEGKGLLYMLTQIALITLVLFCLQGYLTVISKFMLTYLTKGPGKFNIDEYSQLQTLFWLLFVFSRFIATFIAFKMNPIVFLAIVLFLNMFTIFLFLIPYFTNFKLFYWVSISVLGLASGPAHPSTFMAAKYILGDFNSVVISIFSLGLGLSSIVFQHITGNLLDYLQPKDYFLGFKNFDPAYIIAHICFIPCFCSFVIFLMISLIFKRYFHLIQREPY